MSNSQLKIAILVVDYQMDFISGSLALQNGPAQQDAILALPHLNRILEKHDKVALVVYTRDAHPVDHISFLSAAKNPDRELTDEYKNKELEMFSTVEFVGKKTPVTLYPDHCVVNTHGAELHPDLTIVPGAIFIDKGDQTLVESFSGFRDTDRIVHTSLAQILKDHGVNAVICAGIAYDICVYWTSLDAVEFGFKTAVAFEASKGLDLDAIDRSTEEFRTRGIAILDTEKVLQVIDGTLVPDEWK